jgi:hypothetical protein
MKTFENIFYEQDGYAVIGFINSSEELEYTIYTSKDGGFIELENREYFKNELIDLLHDEINTFIDKNKSTTTILD